MEPDFAQASLQASLSEGAVSFVDLEQLPRSESLSDGFKVPQPAEHRWWSIELGIEWDFNGISMVTEATKWLT